MMKPKTLKLISWLGYLMAASGLINMIVVAETDREETAWLVALFFLTTSFRSVLEIDELLTERSMLINNPLCVIPAGFAWNGEAWDPLVDPADKITMPPTEGKTIQSEEFVKWLDARVKEQYMEGLHKAADLPPDFLKPPHRGSGEANIYNKDPRDIHKEPKMGSGEADMTNPGVTAEFKQGEKTDEFEKGNVSR